MRPVLSRTFLFVATTFSVSAATAQIQPPEVYGIINKELRSVSQDSSVPGSSALLISDTDGFESRIGVRGSVGEDDTATQVGYIVELGVNSNLDSGATESRIRPRIVKGTFTGGWGSLTMGQDWMPSATIALQYDPMTATTAQNFNLDDSFVAGALPYSALQGVGYVFRAFKDQVRYSTPNFAGLVYQITVDTNDSTYDQNQVASSLFLEQVLGYELEINPSQKLNLSAIYGKQSTSDSSFESEYYQGGLKYTVNGLAVSVLAGQQLVADDVAYLRTFAGASYDVNDWTFALSYGHVDLGDTHARGIVAVNGEQAKMAAGGFYKLNPNTTLRLIATQVEVTREEGALLDLDNVLATDGETSNKAMLVSLGFRLNF